MFLVIDNYDSFTYNLVQMLAAYGEVLVRRNDALDVAGIRALQPAAIIISPGPGRPENAGVTVPVFKELSSETPIFGVCLGLQALAYANGAEITRAAKLMHGKTSRVYHNSRGLFHGLPNPFTAMRYHSLVVEESSLPAALEITAHTSDGEVMGLNSREGLASAVQFHPESILTEHGTMLLENFLAMHGLTTGVQS